MWPVPSKVCYFVIIGNIKLETLSKTETEATVTVRYKVFIFFILRILILSSLVVKTI